MTTPNLDGIRLSKAGDRRYTVLLHGEEIGQVYAEDSVEETRTRWGTTNSVRPSKKVTYWRHTLEQELDDWEDTRKWAVHALVQRHAERTALEGTR